MSVNIIKGRNGYHLKVNNLYIHAGFGFSIEEIKAIENGIGIPYGATEWVSIHYLRQYWNKYRVNILDSLNIKYNSVWGVLVKQSEPAS